MIAAIRSLKSSVLSTARFNAFAGWSAKCARLRCALQALKPESPAAKTRAQSLNFDRCRVLGALPTQKERGALHFHWLGNLRLNLRLRLRNPARQSLRDCSHHCCVSLSENRGFPFSKRAASESGKTAQNSSRTRRSTKLSHSPRIQAR
jgi:hypothetical protein